MLCCVKRQNKNTRQGLQDVRKQAGKLRPRPFENRNKFRCIFCGGSDCKHENWKLHPNPAIKGLNSDWITDKILATQRLSSRLIKEFDIIDQFKSHGITSVFNLQLPGEHPYCGDGLQSGNTFSYQPEELYEAGLFFYNMGWPDMHAPNISFMVNLVQLMSFVIDAGNKLAVHCHAGYGRTGLAIACYLLYSSEMSAEAAISIVRSKRSKCIQTSKQKKFIKHFYSFLTRIRVLFPEKPISLPEFLANQSVLLHGNNEKQLNGLPKIVHTICSIIRERADQGVYTKQQVAKAFCDPDDACFNSMLYSAFLRSNQEVTTSIDDTYITPSPISSNLAIEQKLHVYKRQLNSYNWNEAKQEKDARILAFLMLDWLENSLLEALLMDIRVVEFLCKWIKENDVILYDIKLKPYLDKAQFRTLECILSKIVCFVINMQEGDLLLCRVVIALMGTKNNHTQIFVGRKLSEIQPSGLGEAEYELFLALKKWTALINQ